MRKIKLEHRLEVQPQPRRTDRAKPASALSDRDIREIQERIASLETEFRRCYERALLVDEKISGVARLLFEVGADRFSHGTRVRFQGGGSPKGHSQLESCLSETAGSIRFPDSAASRRFEFAVQMRT